MSNPRTVYMPPRRQRHTRPPSTTAAFMTGVVVGASLALGGVAIGYSCATGAMATTAGPTEVDCSQTADPFLCELQQEAPAQGPVREGLWPFQGRCSTDYECESLERLQWEARIEAGAKPA